MYRRGEGMGVSMEVCGPPKKKGKKSKAMWDNISTSCGCLWFAIKSHL